MWQRWNSSTHIFEKSSDNGAVWTPLGLSADIITEGALTKARQHAQTAYKDEINVFGSTGGRAIELNGSGAAILDFNDTSRGTDLKRWRVYVAGGNFVIDTVDDAYGSALNSYLVINRVTGNISLPFGQLAFPAAQNPSSDANTLDDYEEGSWTPVDSSGAGLSLTASGIYTKIGRLVFVSGQIIWPATANGATATIGGLPFTSAAINQGFAQHYGAQRLWYLGPSATVFSPLDPTTGSSVTNATMASTNNVISGFYIV